MGVRTVFVECNAVLLTSEAREVHFAFRKRCLHNSEERASMFLVDTAGDASRQHSAMKQNQV